MRSDSVANTTLPVLFTPISIRGVTLRNRICVSPMAMSASENGLATDFHLGHLQGFALGGAGLVMMEGTAVSPQGLVTLEDNGLWSDDHIEQLARIVRQIKKYGAVAGIQLNHSGRKGSAKKGWEGGSSIADNDGGWPTVAPSPIPYDKELIWKIPKEATIDDIEKIKKQFAAAAKRAVTAGFEVIELLFAHGYIVHQFMSPLSNKRTDKYGGSLKNRMRFGLEVAESVAKELSDNIVLGVRITVTDHVNGGWDVQSAVKMAKKLKSKRVDFIDCSGYSGLVPWDPSIKSNPYTVQLAASERIQKEAAIMTSVIGGVISPKYANEIVANSTASMVMLGRAFLNNPHWPYHAADMLGVQIDNLFPKHYAYVISNKRFRDLVKSNYK
ncbi:NADPH dehydrogenase-like [Oppia nitens]|uniref:NADPH dehydrogenase-like n=1 Tax=Oppia nitens TaxID=1686743 RepID=UPI0023DA36B2|nr:NADPH dehydrogenase-like [Oppia nitens]